MPRHDPYLEHVSGTIIGGSYGVCAAVFYDGRPQDRKFFANDDADALKQAKEITRCLTAEASPSCYADKSLWELRIYND